MIGILDYEGKNLNPLNNQPYSEDYKTLAKIWSRFPAYENAKDTIKKIEDNQVVLVVSGTGSGKTVLFPKYVLHALNYKGKIAITLPKQIIAKSAADFAAKTLDVKLGEEVGYQYKGESSKSDKTKLLYATDGTIVARLLNDPLLKDFDAVVIDEAHERKIQIDFLLYLLKQTLKLRPEFKLVIMSATINAEIFKNYFEKFRFEQIDISSGTHYPIESIFLDKPISPREYLNKGLEIIDKILKEDPNDTLFFVTSVNETFQTCNRIKGKTEAFRDGVCVEVYSGIDQNKQELAQDKDLYKKQGYSVKIIAATNVAESSLTIDGIKYVIDSGYELSNYFDPNTRANRLDKMRITKAQAKQRMGRAGRTAPGVCYHLYTQQEYEDMEEFPQPNIRVSDITDESIKLINIVGTVDRLKDTLSKFIEPPRERYVKYALNNLSSYRLIKDNTLTPLGSLVLKLQSYTYQQAIAIVCGTYFRCSQELITIFSVLDACKNNISELFTKPETALDILKLPDSKLQNLTKEYYAFLKKFRSSTGDHISVMNVYEEFKKKKVDNKKIDIFFNMNTLLKALKYRKRASQKRDVNEDDVTEEHLKLMGLKNIEDIKRANIKDKIILCLVVGYRLNFAKKVKGSSLYRVEGTELEYRLSKDSFLHDKEPSSAIFTELFISSGKAEMKVVSQIPNSVKELLM